MTPRRAHAGVHCPIGLYEKHNNMNCRICRDLSVWRGKTASMVEQIAAPPL